MKVELKWCIINLRDALRSQPAMQHTYRRTQSSRAYLEKVVINLSFRSKLVTWKAIKVLIAFRQKNAFQTTKQIPIQVVTYLAVPQS